MRLPSTASTSSKSSDRRRRLDDVVEDVEDEPQKKESAPQTETMASPVEDVSNYDLDELPASALRARALLSRRKEANTSPEPTPPTGLTKVTTREPTPGSASIPPRKDSLAVSSPSPLQSPSIEKDLPAIPNPTPPHIGIGEPAARQTSNSSDLFAPLDTPPVPLTSAWLEHSRHLSTADSDSIQEWSTNVASFNAIKPKKKKLGPRPHVEGPSRPRTSGNSETAVRTRPIANLPTGVRVNTTRPTTSSTNHRPSSQQSSRSVPGRFQMSDLPVPIMPPLPSPNYIAAVYRPTSRASRGVPTSGSGEIANATPEKLRLMKALQLRKRNQLQTPRTSTSSPASTHASTNNNLPEPVDARILMTSSTASPTTLNLSEAQSKASSVTSEEAVDKRRTSLSSDTSSSITPKAGIEVQKKRKSLRKEATDKVAALLSDTQDHKPNGVIASQVGAVEVGPLKVSTDHEGKKTLSRGTSLSSSASRKKRGRPVPEHLAIVSSAEMSELSDGESLLDELANAELQEARPVQVARTPITPITSMINTFKDANSSGATPPHKSRPLTEVRTQSQPGTATPRSIESFDKPKSAGGRSVSTALPHWPPLLSEPASLATKSSVSGGISQRIKALEGFTARQSTSPPRQPVKSEASTRSAFSKFMKRTSQVLDGPQLPNTSTESSPPRRLPLPWKDGPPVLPQPWVQRQGSATQVFHPTYKGETVSVTARIVRDDSERAKPMQSEFGDINLFQSPLIVEHEKQNGDHKGDIHTAESRSLEREPRFSFSAQRLNSSDSFASKLTSSSRKHLTRSPSENSSVGEDKTKPTRAGRLMKRVSNLAAIRRNPKSSSSITKSPSSSANIDFQSHQHHPSTIDERAEHDTTGRPSISEDLLHVVDIGDVNVQFPESLLWKRRFIRIDDQGFLIFSPPANETNSRAVSRKFHLNDFRPPLLPDPEREEMAWSIIMDLKDGRSLQCACESRAGQNQVLQSKCLALSLMSSDLMVNSVNRCTQCLPATVRVLTSSKIEHIRNRGVMYIVDESRTARHTCVFLAFRAPNLQYPGKDGYLIVKCIIMMAVSTIKRVTGSYIGQDRKLMENRNRRELTGSILPAVRVK